MKFLIKLSWNFLFIGILIGFALLIAMVFIPNFSLLIASLIILHLFGLMLGVKFFITICGFYSSILTK
jgi:hypothetical protein